MLATLLWRRGGVMALASLLAVSSACATAKKPIGPEDAVGPTQVRVENQGFTDMNIFAYRSTLRTRLGLAGGHSTTTLTVPASLVFGATPLRFVAEPVGGSRASVSMEINVSPGDVVSILIPPNN